MKFYTKQRPYYCGIDLHTKTMYVCIVDKEDKILIHKDIPIEPDAFLNLIEPYLEGLVVGCECMFFLDNCSCVVLPPASMQSWYWLADLCVDKGIEFVLGHALYMTKSSGAILNSFSWPEGENTGMYFIKAIHGGKTKNDKIDSLKITKLLKGGVPFLNRMCIRHRCEQYATYYLMK